MPVDDTSDEALRGLLRNIHIYIRRGDYDTAEEQIHEALKMDPGNAEIQELWGDFLLLRGKTQDAAEAFHRAIGLAPEAESPELKYARAVLKLSEIAEQDERLKRALTGGSLDADAPVRNPLVSFFASSLLPGLGQLYNGETTKAIVLSSVWGGCLLVLLLTGDFKRLMEITLSLVFPGKLPQPPSSIGILSSMLWGGGAVAWLYGIIDAWLTSAKRVRTPTDNYTEPDY